MKKMLNNGLNARPHPEGSSNRRGETHTNLREGSQSLLISDATGD